MESRVKRTRLDAQNLIGFPLDIRRNRKPVVRTSAQALEDEDLQGSLKIVGFGMISMAIIDIDRKDRCSLRFLPLSGTAMQKMVYYLAQENHLTPRWTQMVAM
jgi:hypothetical protein